MNKKMVVIIATVIIIVAIGLLGLCTGGKMAGIIINKYSISEDGSVMTLKVGVASSMGSVRTVKEKSEKNKKYLTFYSTYGFNSTIGAKNEFQIKLDPSMNEIYFYSGDTGYKLKLQKNEDTNEWILVK